MGLNDVKFNVLNGGLGRQGANPDMTTGFILDSYIVGSDVMDILKFENASQAEVWVKEKLEDETIGFNAAFGGDWKKHLYLVFLISDFYRINPNATLYVAVVDLDDSTLFDRILESQLFANGEIRQFGILSSDDNAIETIANVNNCFIQMDVEHRPSISVISNPTPEAANAFISGGSLLDYVDENDLQGKHLSVMLGGNDDLKKVIDNTLPVMSALGCVMGLVSLSKVSESIAWVEQRNMMREDRGFLIPILKKLYKNKHTALSLINWYVNIITIGGTKLTDYPESQLVAIQDKGYLFPRKHVGIDGSYMNEAFTLDERTSDYSKIQYTRTMQKCTRVLRKALLPQLNSPIRIEPSTGEIAADVIAFFEGLCEDALAVMNDADEISGAAVQVMPILEDDTNTPGQKKLVIKQQIVPFGSADSIENNIGFAVRI